MPYWKLYYHLIWATRSRQPIILPENEAQTHRVVAGAAERHGMLVLAVGGIEDHVHLAVSIPPTLSVAKAVGLVKGASSHMINEEFSEALGAVFAWQTEYGVVSFSESQMDPICRYIRGQRERHETGRLVAGLELDSATTSENR
jgi:putative transposase